MALSLGNGLFMLALTLFCSADANGMFQSADCKPHPILVPIDHPNYAFYPYIVKMHRCGGVCSHASPSIEECVVTESKNVTVPVYDMEKGRMHKLKLLNHTKCGCGCVTKPSDCTASQVYNKDSCQCRCKYRNTRPEPCPNGFRWSNTNCACMCHRPPKFCSVGKVWNTKECECICSHERISQCKKVGMTVDDKCECKSIEIGAHKGLKPQESPKFSKFTLLLMVGEFVVLCIIFDAILIRWKAGFIYTLVQKLKCKGRLKDAKTVECSNIGKDNTTEVSSVSPKEEYVEQV